MFHTLKYERTGAVVTLTLARPDRKNAISPEMANELLYALEHADQDQEARAVVLTGAGGNFCSGGDFGAMGGGSTPSTLPIKGDYASLLQAMVQYPRPLVARVEGYAMGGGLGLVAACHFALAADSAVLATPEIHRGLFPMMIMAVLARQVPRRALLEMMLVGSRFSAARGVELGLLNRAVPLEALDAEVSTLVTELAKRSPTAMRRGLAAWAKQGDLKLEEALPFLRDELYALLGTDDAREGLMAFMEKREPRWTGH